MNLSDAMWRIFKQTGHIGAYLIYKDFQYVDSYVDSNKTDGLSGREFKTSKNEIFNS